MPILQTIAKAIAGLAFMASLWAILIILFVSF